MENKKLQSDLFPEDKVFNVLETDVTMIKADIEARHNRIGKLRSEIDKLGERLAEVEEARDIVAKTRDEIAAKVGNRIIDEIQNGKTG